MTYNNFRTHFMPFQVFSITDVKKAFPDFDSRRLVEWSRKNYIEKIINKWYRFKEIPLDELLLMRIGNCIYQPSYISLSSALSFYGLIPEGVFVHQAVTSLKTVSYNTSIGRFEYRSIKPSLYFGYKIINENGLPVLIAEKEKALLDFCYLTSSLGTKADVAALRLNTQMSRQLDWNKIKEYSLIFNSTVLNKRILWIKQICQNDLVS
jgi:predicted transcriptional regulator of viral defense system